jgi:hypothetical protein
MKMIPHQAIGMHLPAGFRARFGNGLEKVLAVHIVEEYVFSAVAPAHDVIDRAGILKSHFPGHENSRADSQVKTTKE